MTFQGPLADAVSTTMPVANRGWFRLTATGAPHLARDYLKAQSPACSTLGASLVLVAFLVAICLGVRHFHARRRSTRSPNAACPLITYTAENVDKDSPEQGSGPVADEQARKDEKNSDPRIMVVAKSEQVRIADNRVGQRTSPIASDPQWHKPMDDSPLGLMSRPPPAPPLTPPELSTSVFTLTRRPHSQDSFMHQPNPDYMSPTESPNEQMSPSSPSPSGAQRRSYTRLFPGGSSGTEASSSAEQDSGDVTFLSTSYPPTTSLLPPAPPGWQEEEDPRRARQIEVQGEIISVLDGEGAGWTRHTRVYGGGVCLACAASGGNHGGGFYGANVSPEEMH